MYAKFLENLSKKKGSSDRRIERWTGRRCNITSQYHYEAGYKNANINYVLITGWGNADKNIYHISNKNIHGMLNSEKNES